MTYTRVIPRDLFNEANLLKCYGQLYLELEKLGLQDLLSSDGGAFRVVQDPSDGSLTLANVRLPGVRLSRPLNSRGAYPLWLHVDDEQEFEIFEIDGAFTAETQAFMRSYNHD